MKEDALIKACLNQNRTCQKLLYDRYCKQMYAVCLRYHSDVDLAKESLQRGFIKTFEKLNQYKSTGSLGGWIRTIIVRENINVLKERKKLKYDEIDERSDSFVHEESANHKDIVFQDMIKILKKLPDGYRTVFSLYVLDEYKHDEIAEMLNISTTTSRSQLSKAKAMLRKLIVQDYEHLIMNQ